MRFKVYVRAFACSCCCCCYFDDFRSHTHTPNDAHSLSFSTFCVWFIPTMLSTSFDFTRNFIEFPEYERSPSFFVISFLLIWQCGIWTSLMNNSKQIPRFGWFGPKSEILYSIECIEWSTILVLLPMGKYTPRYEFGVWCRECLKLKKKWFDRLRHKELTYAKVAHVQLTFSPYCSFDAFEGVVRRKNISLRLY